jgi:AbrB family looped-hinge helix DNA binding protein
MTILVKAETDLVVPKSVRRKAGIKAGDRVEFAVSGRVIHIVPKMPYADDTFTAEESALIVKARREMRAGKFVSLTQVEHELARKPSPRRRKTA